MDVWTLARANGIYNLNWIYAGQWLRIPNCNPSPLPPVPPRRNVSGTWVSKNCTFELQEALGCPSPHHALTGRYIEARGTTTPDMVDVTGTVDVTSRIMTRQLGTLGTLTFTKR